MWMSEKRKSGEPAERPSERVREIRACHWDIGQKRYCTRSDQGFLWLSGLLTSLRMLCYINFLNYCLTRWCFIIFIVIVIIIIAIILNKNINLTNFTTFLVVIVAKSSSVGNVVFYEYLRRQQQVQPLFREGIFQGYVNYEISVGTNVFDCHLTKKNARNTFLAMKGCVLGHLWLVASSGGFSFCWWWWQ